MYSARKPTTRPSSLIVDEDGQTTSGGGLEFYKEPPKSELSLDDFEQYALSRLKVLRKIEELKSSNRKMEDYAMELKSTLKKEQLDGAKDLASHYILRAAYCRTEELRRWFLTQECHLFKFKCEQLVDRHNALVSVLQKNNLHFDLLSNAEKERLLPLLASMPNMTPAVAHRTTYYQIPFTQALDLVASRQCYVSRGYAYVPLPKIISTLVAKFRVSLSKSLVMASAAFTEVLSSSAEASRLAPLLQTMNAQYTGSCDYNTNNDMTDQDLNALNVSQHVANMPLCMSQIHSGLVRDHKLKHHGRLQYILFLKGAGLSMEESLLFFQREFTKIMSTEQFNKQYSYTIRHLYGKEGRRENKRPYNCMKIIFQQPPQSNEHHGCPYKHYDEEHLSALLNKLQIGSVPDRQEILKLKSQKNFQLACVKHFEATHPNAVSVLTKADIDMGNVGSHPNAWFAASVSYHKLHNTHTDNPKQSETPIKQESRPEITVNM